MNRLETETPHVFIVGSKGIPAQYGGFETFVDKLTAYSARKIHYHVACLSREKGVFFYHDAECVRIPTPAIGPARAVYCDCAALDYFIRYCRAHPEIKRPIFYLLACRIGFAIRHYTRRIHELNGVLYVNPDGQEWKRRKWCWAVRQYWKYSAGRTLRCADRIICDSRAIQADIRERCAAGQAQILYISYGAEKAAPAEPGQLDAWLDRQGLSRDQYYLLVGRFVPENNFETILREFMASNSTRALVVITGQNRPLMEHIRRATGCETDGRIRFVGTVYDPALLCAIRENAYASFHGHEVGGTNPSLLEGLRCTRVNLVLDVAFNREVGGEDAALYWTKQAGSLRALIDRAEMMDEGQRARLGGNAVRRMQALYSWPDVAQAYTALFTEDGRP